MTKKPPKAKTPKTMKQPTASVIGKVKAQKIAKTGLKSRVRGHVSARGKRAQGRRDSR